MPGKQKCTGCGRLCSVKAKGELTGIHSLMQWGKMNTVLLFESDFISGDTVRFTGRRLNHIRSVIGSRRGDELKIGLLNGRMGSGSIRFIDETSCEMKVVLNSEPPSPLPCTLVLAMPRPKSLKKALEAAVVLGVKKVFIIQSWRVEKSYWSSPVLTVSSLNEIMYLGLEQAGDTVLPKIEIRRRFKPFVEDEFCDLASDTEALVAHPEADAVMPHDIGRPVTLVIGPEGGFIPFEVELLEKYGCRSVSFSERILRVEHAVSAFLGRLF